jgi:hypothetical protein
LTSRDGTAWDSQSSGVRGNLSGVVYGNSKFVAVGAGEIVYSMCEQAAATLNYKLQNTNYKQITNYNVQNYNSIKIDPTGPHALGPGLPLKLLTPNGDETLQAGEKFLITWKSEPNVEKIKLEYSPDNGTTYLPIAVDVANTGHYEWLVPHHISSNCLVRVSEVKEKKMPPHGLVYELDFRVNGAEFYTGGESFTIYLGDAANETIKNNLPRVSFSYESNGKVYIHLDNTGKEIERFTGFNDKWHNIRIFMDNVYDRISVILDGEIVFENIPRDAMTYFSPALSFSMGPGKANDVEIDDVVVQALYTQEKSIQGNTSSYPGPHALGLRQPLKWFTLFREDFGRLKEKNDLDSSGWRTKGKQILVGNQKESGENVFAELAQVSEQKTLYIKAGEENRGRCVQMIKSFLLTFEY